MSDRTVEESRPRIILVRHGRSALPHPGRMNAAGFRDWRAAYEAAGIEESERAPSDLQRLAAGSAIVASDAPRATATAQLLAPAGQIVVSPLLRELELEAPSLGTLRLPFLGWAVAVGIRALVLSVRKQYPSPAESARISEAAEWLESVVREKSVVLAVTHGSFRRHLADRLRQSGWMLQPGRRTHRHWSAWVLERHKG